jgi:predicted RNase H-like HicB family nuclease
MRDYIVIYERAADVRWGAYIPDPRRLGVIGDRFEESEKLIRAGIMLHIGSLVEDGLSVPNPTTIATHDAVAA